MNNFIDLKNMPNADLTVKDGMNSISHGLVIESSYYCPNTLWSKEHKGELMGDFRPIPVCVSHGDMNMVSMSGIWRCLNCGVGCYEVGIKLGEVE